MKSASNRGILKGRLQVLHVHVLLVAPLSTGHMAQPGFDRFAAQPWQAVVLEMEP